MLCLVTLMVFLGLLIALAPVAFAYLEQSQSSHSSGLTRSANKVVQNCNPIIVTFADDAPLRKVSQFLDQLNASIAFGPNENGAFELNLADGSPQDVVNALNSNTSIVSIASLRDQCLNRR